MQQRQEVLSKKCESITNKKRASKQQRESSIINDIAAISMA